jgi:hypothetical protein
MDTPLTVTGSMPQGLKRSRPIRQETEIVTWSTAGGSLVLHIDSTAAPNFWLEMNLTREFVEARLAELQGAGGLTSISGA